MLPAGISSEGSPPRGRGKVCIAFLGLSASRITPAWAGKSHHFVGISEMVWDHPRVGGEKPPPGAPPQTSLGSPPRGRGKGQQARNGHGAQGITPAWAGKSCTSRNCNRCSRDHPRVGGEKCVVAPLRTRCRGSPPRGRGKGRHPGGSSDGNGITPAWAGKRRKHERIRRRHRDHPRVGGEKVVNFGIVKRG